MNPDRIEIDGETPPRPAMTPPEHARLFLSHLVDDPAATWSTEIRVIHAEYAQSGPDAIIPNPKFPSNMAGHFDSIDAAMKPLDMLRGASAYVCLNPGKAELLARENHNKLRGRCRVTTSDGDILHLRWLFVDIDPVRPADISSTDGELALAVAVRDRILADNIDLARSAIWGKSGNGCYIIVRLPDYPNDAAHRQLIADALASLAARYSDARVKIDPTTKNPSRIACIPGTMKCKGSDTPDRPWRRATVDGVWGRRVDDGPEPPATGPTPPPSGPFDLGDWVAANPPPAPAPRAPAKAAHRARNGTGTPAATAPWDGDREHLLFRAGRYADGFDPAIAGDGGHNQTFDLACALVKGFDLTVDEARPILDAFNNRCVPPWSPQELEHKLVEADEKPDDKPRGYLLNAGREAGPAVEPVDVATLAADLAAIVAGGDVGALYRAAGLLDRLARLERIDPAEAEALKATLANLKGFKARAFDKVMAAHRKDAGQAQVIVVGGGGGAEGEVDPDSRVGGVPGRKGQGWPLTDLGNAHRFVEHYGWMVRYCPVFESWFVYDGRRWAADSGGSRVSRLAHKVPELIMMDQEGKDEEACAAIAEWSIRTQANERLRAIPTLASSYCTIEPRQLDSDPWLLNVLNGTFNLQTQRLQPHDPKDLITKICGVAHDGSAGRPSFDPFILDIMSNDPEVVAYLRRCFGYAATGVVRQHCLFICYGQGRNGKGTLFRALRNVLGDYAAEISADLLMAQNSPQHPTGLTELDGRRLIEAEETREGHHLAEDVIKKLSGGNQIQARKLYHDFYYFEPTHHLFLATNHQPQIRGTDPGIRDRIKMIPFKRYYDEASQDHELEAKLEADGPGLLNWIIEGCREWQEIGLAEPATIREETQKYLEEQDVIGQFLDERFEIRKGDDSYRANFAYIYQEYAAFCEQSGLKVQSKRRFGGTLNDRGFPSLPSNGTTFKLGLRGRQAAQWVDQDHAGA